MCNTFLNPCYSEQPPMMKKVLFQMYYFKEIVRLKMFAHFAIIHLVD